MLFVLQTCFRFVKQELHQSSAIPLNPYKNNFLNNILWSTVLNAFLRSRKITPFIIPESIFSNQEFVELNKDGKVKCPSLKPD